MKKKRSNSSTEMAIGAVSPSEYMSTAQLEFFRLRLEDERKLLENAQGTLVRYAGSLPNRTQRPGKYGRRIHA
jgi:DnaK suppressor protein